MPQRKDEQQSRVENRVEERAAHREEVRTRLKQGGLRDANDPERVRLREQRLAAFYGEKVLAPAAGAAERGEGDGWPGEPLDEGGVALAQVALASPGERILERVVGTSDFLGVRYLEGGVAAQRAVARIDIRDPATGQRTGFGTGFMVSPRLLLTNNHVLETHEAAAASKAEFGFQEGLDGKILESVVFDLDPEALWITDEELDFSLVAVKDPGGLLPRFGFLRLIGAQGKVVVGECVSIIQHPGGQPKQVALRDNRIVDIFEHFIHYETDTERGASGSAASNDQWEVVALHHASVQARDGDGFVNEGIRVSSLIERIRQEPLSDPDRERLREELLNAGTLPRAEAAPGAATPSPAGLIRVPQIAPVPAALAEDRGRSVTIPLEITIRLGVGGEPVAITGEFRPGPPAPGGDGALAREASSIDPDYDNRAGYDPGFLGEGALRVPLPSLSAAMLARAAVNRQANRDARHVLPYHHFSVVMNSERRMAFLTAVNIDGRISHRIKRDPDTWIPDPRIPRDQQTNDALYADNDLDRGHLVRRLDPAWGSSEQTARAANDDTFHFTNCIPQHRRFNRESSLWAGLEDYILDNTDNRDLRVSVFTGPVFDEANDIRYRGLRLPLQFWKVVVMVRENGRLSATGYLLSQESLLRGMNREALRPSPESFEFGAYRTYQVPVGRIERLTGLDFGALPGSDPLAGRESSVEVHRGLESLGDIRL